MTDAFADLVLPIFQRGIDLLAALDEGQNPTLDQVKDQARAWIEGAEKRASASHNLSLEFDLAKFGLVSWIDEILTDSRWGESVGWGEEEHVLEWDLYQSHDRGYVFYEQAEQVYTGVTQKRCSADPLETYFLCVALGFVGDYRHDDAKFEAWVTRYYEKLSENLGLADRAFPSNYQDAAGTLIAPRSGPALLLAVSILVSITAVATLFAYIAAVGVEYASYS